MPALFAIVLLGLFLGMRHATDPDHVIAVTTIVSRERTAFHAAIIGALWGIGHTITLVGVGTAIILLRIAIPAKLGLTMELSVACMLVLLGALNVFGLLQAVRDWFESRGLASGMHTHLISGRLIFHTHDRGGPDSGSVGVGRLPPWLQKLGVFHALRPLLVGIVHGLAGSAAVALLALTAINRPGWAIAYLLVFGFGTVLGMMIITSAIALPFLYTLQHFERLNRGLAIASGVTSLSFGLFLFYQIGFSDGLFVGHLNWVPR